MDFCLWVSAALLFFFYKINVLQVCGLTKAMTKKTDCNTAEQPAFGAASRACAVGFLYIRFAMDFLKDIFVNLLSSGIWDAFTALLSFILAKKSLQRLQRCNLSAFKKNLFFN